MSLKARLRIAIISLVTLVVIAMALMYLYDFTKLTFSLAASRAGLIADQVKGNLVDRLDRETSTRGLHPASLEEWKNIWTGMIRSDPRITDMLRRVWTNAEFVGTIQVTDEQGKLVEFPRARGNSTSFRPATGSATCGACGTAARITRLSGRWAWKNPGRFLSRAWWWFHRLW